MGPFPKSPGLKEALFWPKMHLWVLFKGLVGLLQAYSVPNHVNQLFFEWDTLSTILHVICIANEGQKDTFGPYFLISGVQFTLRWSLNYLSGVSTRVGLNALDLPNEQNT